MSYKNMTTEELIAELRDGMASASLILAVADRLESLEEDVNEWMITFDMLNDRENRSGYLTWWREKNGEDELTYPDSDEVYKDFFAMKAKVEELTEENEDLTIKLLARMMALTTLGAVKKELTAENERLHASCTELTQNLHECKADTVRKMHSEIKKRCIEGGIYPAFVASTIDRVAKEMLEGIG